MATSELPPLRATAASSSPVEAYLQRVHARYADLAEGDVATYIPELATVDPDQFGIAIATVQGSVYEVGDTRVPFTIQSLSKPFTYAYALDTLGESEVHRAIGVEPTGDAFNSITFHPSTGAPLNAMVNAGAIAAVELAGRPDRGRAMERLLEALGRFAGRDLGIDERVYLSERDTGHRNRAMAHLLRGNGILQDDPDAVVDRYFRQCSVQVDVRDLAVMAATLAAGGRNPVTGVQAASRRTIRTVLSVMASCGMYDGAGEWFVGVGLPAKSGVSGGIIAVLPGQLGIAVWSPPLDARGNSVRGIAVCRDLSSAMDLHTFTAAFSPSTPIRGHGTLATRRSKRIRSPRDQARLLADGASSHVIELQGEVGFAAVETVMRVLGPLHEVRDLVVDLARVTWLDPAVAPLLADLVATLAGSGEGALCWADGDACASTLDAVDRLLQATGVAEPMRAAEIDAALEWSEERLLARGDAIVREGIDVTEHPVLAGLSPDAMAALRPALEARTWQPGDAVVRRGDPAGDLYLVIRGDLSVYVPMEGRVQGRRLATLTAGMVLGEVSFLSEGHRTADVIADTEVRAMVLDADRFRAIRQREPDVAAALLENLYRMLAQIAARLTSEVAALAA
jgi:glutaminase